MRHAYEESELLKLTRRYVTPGQRYLKLGGSLLGMSGRERAKFTRKLGKAASDISLRAARQSVPRGRAVQERVCGRG